MSVRNVIVGTAGHIDHGKTALVKALTGIDADRLEEEKRRGITIDLGFANVQIGETLFAFIDVPGHEKFVRNMLAGVGGIDIVLLVVSADEGVMPQTREHFEICKLLGIKHGAIALTKLDLASNESVFLIKEELAQLVRGSFLENAPVVAVSSLRGDGLEALRRDLWNISQTLEAHDQAGLTRLPIDRVFTMKGFGTVVTGTLISGAVRKDEELEVHPGGRRLRVRNVQVHGMPAEIATAGHRVALNLASVEKNDLARGMMLAAPGQLRTTQFIDSALNMLSGVDLKTSTRVHLHSYSAETVATVKEVSSNDGNIYARLRLDDPIQVIAGDRFILRRFSPVTTIGGGTVIDPLPHLRTRLAQRTISDDRISTWIAGAGINGLSLTEIVTRSGRSASELQSQLETRTQTQKVRKLGDTYFSDDAAHKLVSTAEQTLRAFHAQNRLAGGMNADELRGALHLNATAFEALFDELARKQIAERSGDTVRLRGAGVRMEDAEAAAMKQITDAFLKAGLKVPALPDVLAGLKVPRDKATKIVTLLLRERTLIKLADDLVFHKDALANLRGLLVDYKSRTKKNTIDVATFKDLTGISRKYAIPLLEYLDRERVTRREGNVRTILV
jgi:selenocysteine-specific elongation factor